MHGVHHLLYIGEPWQAADTEDPQLRGGGSHSASHGQLKAAKMMLFLPAAKHQRHLNTLSHALTLKAARIGHPTHQKQHQPYWKRHKESDEVSDGSDDQDRLGKPGTSSTGPQTIHIGGWRCKVCELSAVLCIHHH